MMARKNISLIIGLAIVVLLTLSAAGLYSDYLWFSDLGYKQVFMVSLEASILVFLLCGAALFVFLFLNLYLASKLSKSFIPLKLKAGAALLVSFFAATAAIGAWPTLLKYFRQVPFGITDPIFGKDAAFYLFSLPFWWALWKFAAIAVAGAFVLVLLDYLQGILLAFFQGRSQVNIRTELAKIKKGSFVHLSVLGSIFFVLLSARHYLEKYSIMYSEQGIVVGAGFTDVEVVLPVITILMAAAFAVSLAILAWMVFRGRMPRKSHLLLYLIAGYFAFSILGQGIVPALVQSLKVNPNEFRLEKPYIENNMAFTRAAYGLSVEESVFAANQNIDLAALKRSEKTVGNIRILDWRPLTDTYKQTQEIRLYYDLSNIDLDRYKILGKETQVLLSARELDQEQVPPGAQTWVNLHLVYTHGYGVVMSPVNSVTDQGLPNYLIKDIPPQVTVPEPAIEIRRPEIYFGEKENSFILVNTGTEEFNYPKGNTNEYSKFNGTSGILLDSFFRKLLFALRFSDIKIMLSTDISDNSKILYDRSIQKRTAKIAPFLMLDKDPYLVVENGRLYWIQDAYTVTGNYPYSQRYRGINYIRNSVKVVMDAFNGDITFYVMQSEPIIDTYRRIFPELFRDYADMPEGLKRHIRYPEDMFRIQSEIFATYHMTDANVFYNKEDAWDLPNEIYGTGQQVKVEPYYNIIKLPGEETEEFVLMVTFTPVKKDNIVAWFAARSDSENYGRLILYTFPKDRLVYGPSQIEARIDQDGDISEQLTLWSQQGSHVTRGNLLVIPIEDSLLYVEPLYLQSDKGQLPELRRVIVSDGERVVMEKTLGLALENLFGKAEAKPSLGRTEDELILDANSLYEDALLSLRQGNWTLFGQKLDELGRALAQLRGR